MLALGNTTGVVSAGQELGFDGAASRRRRSAEEKTRRLLLVPLLGGNPNASCSAASRCRAPARSPCRRAGSGRIALRSDRRASGNFSRRSGRKPARAAGPSRSACPATQRAPACPAASISVRELRPAIGDPRKNRRDQHAGVDAPRDEPGERPHPGVGRRGSCLEAASISGSIEPMEMLTDDRGASEGAAGRRGRAPSSGDLVMMPRRSPRWCSSAWSSRRVKRNFLSAG